MCAFYCGSPNLTCPSRSLMKRKWQSSPVSILAQGITDHIHPRVCKAHQLWQSDLRVNRHGFNTVAFQQSIQIYPLVIRYKAISLCHCSACIPSEQSAHPVGKPTLSETKNLIILDVIYQDQEDVYESYL